MPDSHSKTSINVHFMSNPLSRVSNSSQVLTSHGRKKIYIVGVLNVFTTLCPCTQILIALTTF